MSTPKNIYVGKRYIPKHCGDWDNSKNTVYESLSVVLYQGASYTSKQDVPKGIDISNILYWVKSADYNAQVAIYEQNVRDYHQYVIDQIGIINDDNESFKNEVGANFLEYKDDLFSQNQNNFNTYKNNIDVDINNFSNKIKNIVTYDITKHDLYNNNDISIAINAIKPLLSSGDTLLLPSGYYKSASCIDLQFDAVNGKDFINIDFRGHIQYIGTDDACIKLSGQNLNININHVYKDKGTFVDSAPNYSLLSNKGIYFGMLYHSNVIIGLVEYFETAIYLKPTNSQGVQYCYFRFYHLRHNLNGISLNVGDINSWCTESIYEGGKIRGQVGVKTTKLSGQLGAFGNNRFNNIGMEDVIGNGFELNFCDTTSIHHPRFERVGGYYVYENSDCTYTFIFTPYRVLVGNIYLSGISSVCKGTLGIQGNNNYNILYKVCDKKQIVKYFDCNMQPVPITNEFKFTNAYNTNVNIEHGARVVHIKTDTATVDVKVDNGIWKTDGYEFYVNVINFTNAIRILKPDNTVAVNSYMFTQTGTYKIINVGGEWLMAVRIGSALGN
jgi:hypothetical protein